MPMPKHLLGNDLVREARKRAGLTQQELAERAGTTQSAIARLEAGRAAPSFATVLTLVRACGLDLEVALVEPPLDDLDQAAGIRPLGPADRVERHARVTHQLRELRLAGARARGGVA